MGSLAVRGVRGMRCGEAGAGVVKEGKAAVDGPAPPFCFEDADEDDEEDARIEACPLSCDMRLPRALLGVSLWEAVLDPRRPESRVSLSLLVRVSMAFCWWAIPLLCSRSDEWVVLGEESDG